MNAFGWNAWSGAALWRTADASLLCKNGSIRKVRMSATQILQWDNGCTRRGAAIGEEDGYKKKPTTDEDDGH